MAKPIPAVSQACQCVSFECLSIPSRQPSSVLKGLRPHSQSKVALWQELKLVSWARTLSATWLAGLLDLLLRVQLNILGRHLYMQQQWCCFRTLHWENIIVYGLDPHGAWEWSLQYAQGMPCWMLSADLVCSVPLQEPSAAVQVPRTVN